MGGEPAMSLDEWLSTTLEEGEKYKTCMSLFVSQDGASVELMLDTSRADFGEWIPGEGSDICLYRDMETKKVIGCRLPLLCERLVVQHDGPIRINAGFLEGDEE